jgi:hypothetical protein
MKKIIINLVLFIFISSFFSNDSFAKVSQKEQAKIDSIEVYYLGHPPKRTYKIISPISDTSKTEQRSFQYMKKEAVNVGADAILDFECKDEKRLKINWTIGQQSFANCRGIAIKWVQ